MIPIVFLLCATLSLGSGDEQNVTAIVDNVNNEIENHDYEADDYPELQVRAAQCPQPNGFFANPTDCRLYLRCTGGQAELLTCSQPLYWDQATRKCEPNGEADCGGYRPKGTNVGNDTGGGRPSPPPRRPWPPICDSICNPGAGGGYGSRYGRYRPITSAILASYLCNNCAPGGGGAGDNGYGNGFGNGFISIIAGGGGGGGGSGRGWGRRADA